MICILNSLLKGGRLEKLLDWDGSRWYRFQCDCLHAADAMDVGVDEAGKDGKWFQISMQFNSDSLIDRMKYAWQILLGHWTWREFVVRKEDEKVLSDIFNPDIGYSKLP